MSFCIFTSVESRQGQGESFDPVFHSCAFPSNTSLLLVVNTSTKPYRIRKRKNELTISKIPGEKMINLKSSISTIEKLLRENSDQSLTYAALECRLSIECICYERLRLAHDYISHDDLKKWQPRDIVNIIIQEVDPKAASTYTLSISKEPCPEDVTLKEYQAMEYIPIGKQVGFDPDKLGKLWNGLAHLALHISVPVNKDDVITHYGSPTKIRAKVVEALKQIKQIDAGTLTSSGMGKEVSFDCVCGANNKRRLGLLNNGQVISCIKAKCDESFEYVKSEMSFERRTFEITCQKCGKQFKLPKRKMEKLRTDQHLHCDCEGCEEKIFIQWQPMQAQELR